jgi:hypothetical protein
MSYRVAIVADDLRAVTAGGGRWDDQFGDQAFCLNVPLYGTPPCPCPLACPPGAIPEAEACGQDTNGGCDVDPPVFGQASCNDVI